MSHSYKKNAFVLVVYMRARTLVTLLLVWLLLSRSLAEANLGVNFWHIQVTETREDVHLTSASADTPSKPNTCHAWRVLVSKQNKRYAKQFKR